MELHHISGLWVAAPVCGPAFRQSAKSLLLRHALMNYMNRNQEPQDRSLIVCKLLVLTLQGATSARRNYMQPMILDGAGLAVIAPALLPAACHSQY